MLTQPGRAGGTTALLRYELKRLMSEASKRMMQVAYEDRPWLSGTGLSGTAAAWDAAKWDRAAWDAAKWDRAAWNGAKWDRAAWNGAKWDRAKWDAGVIRTAGRRIRRDGDEECGRNTNHIKSTTYHTMCNIRYPHDVQHTW